MMDDKTLAQPQSDEDATLTADVLPPQRILVGDETQALALSQPRTVLTADVLPPKPRAGAAAVHDDKTNYLDLPLPHADNLLSCHVSTGLSMYEAQTKRIVTGNALY